MEKTVSHPIICPSINHRQTATHTQHLTRNVAGRIRSEENDGGGDFARVGGAAAERNGFDHGSSDFAAEGCFVEGVEDGGVGDAGGDNVDADIVAGMFAGHRFGEGNNGRFTARLNRFPHAAAPPRVGSDIHKAAASLGNHLRQGSVGHVE